MSARSKFLFDNDFASGAGSKQTSVAQAQHQRDLAEAEARGHREGIAVGKAQLAAETEHRLAVALERTAASLETLGRGLGAVEARLEQETVTVAIAAARRLAGELVAREPLGELSALAADCFRHLVGAPHVVVRVGDALYEEARVRLTEIAQRCGFDGRLVVLAEPDIAIGDCRIEWADGGAVRDRAAIETAIAAAVENYLAVRRAADSAHHNRSSPA